MLKRYASILLVVIVSITLAYSYTSSVIIHNYGSIRPSALTPFPTIMIRNEIRAVFFHQSSLRSNNDWNAIMNVLYEGDVSTIIIEGMLPTVVIYPSTVAQNYGIPCVGLDFIKLAVSYAHSLGIDVYVAMDVLGPGVPASHPEWAAVDYDGVVATTEGYPWMNPIHPTVKAYLKALVEELVTLYPQIDGFMFDYIRWMWQSTGGTPPTIDYSSYSKTALEQWLGETISVFPGEFAPSGSRFNEFLEWRVAVITDLVTDMGIWMRNIKPDLKLAAAPWSFYMSESDSQIRHFLGQDWQDWAMKGLVDWIAPMIYQNAANLETTFRPTARANIRSLGGPKGVIPMPIFIANQYPDLKTPQQLADQVNVLRQEGADGWVIWKYGGPGDPTSSVGIQPFLDAIPPISPLFSIQNIALVSNDSSAVISWTTTTPTTSKVEYGTSPLFTSSTVFDPGWGGFNYTDIVYNPGIIVEDLIQTTNHVVTLTDLQAGETYYFRVQSYDSVQTASTKVYTFTQAEI